MAKVYTRAHQLKYILLQAIKSIYNRTVTCIQSGRFVYTIGQSCIYNRTVKRMHTKKPGATPKTRQAWKRRMLYQIAVQLNIIEHVNMLTAVIIFQPIVLHVVATRRQCNNVFHPICSIGLPNYLRTLKPRL